MVQVSRRTDFTGSTLIRLLARLTDTDVPESKEAFADRLSQWLRWTDAISLSAALDGAAPAAPSGPQASASVEEGECARVRTALAKAIADDGAAAGGNKARRHLRAPAQEASMDTSADFSSYRWRYLARQQAMEAGIGRLRGRLRTALAAGSPTMARLAAVDAVMEQALGAQAHRLLSSVPALLEKHFQRLRRAGQAAPDEAAPTGAWLEVFRKDMQDLLLAELDFRMQPVEGLLEALRTRQPG